MKYIFTVLFAVTFLAARSQSIVYVTPGGAGNQSGGSWSDALPSSQLQSRLASATSGTQFWIAGGRYSPGILRTATFQIPSGVQVYGGFTGNEGQLANRMLSQPSSTTFTGETGDLNTVGDNNRHVVTFRNVSASTRLDGVMITGGNADNRSTDDGYGGGVFNKSIQSGNSSNPTIASCYFVNNQASYGAGMANYATAGSSGNPTLINCFFVRNSAEEAGGLWNSGVSATANPMLMDCVFESNISTLYNGGAIISQGTNDANGIANLTLRRCTFTKNKANYGGAIFLAGLYGQSSPVISSCTFYSNTAINGGGAISSASFASGITNARVDNCLFAYNFAARGGAISNSTNNGTCNPEFKNCTITNNRLILSPNNVDNHSGAIDNSGQSGSCSPTLVNCIVWENSTDSFNKLAIANIEVAYSIINYSDIQGDFAGTGNINKDPFFVNPQGSDFRLLSISPAINTGDPNNNGPATELDGAPRLIANRIDMGAYEFKARFGTSVIVYVTPTGTGDGSGTSWTNALSGSQLQQATVEAQSETVFWIAQGIYKPASNTDRYKSFWVSSGVQVYGGFNGTETSLSQRNIAINPTIFSGNIGSDTNTDNSYHVVRFRNAGPATRLDGVTIQDGNENTNYDNLFRGLIKGGGGLYNDGSGRDNLSQPTITNCRIINNEASYRGGGLFNDGSDSGQCLPTVINCYFEANAGGLGGAICNHGITGVSSATLINSTFYNNRANKGAAIYCTAENTISARSDINVTNCAFIKNLGFLEGGAAFFDSGIGGTVKPIFRNCAFYQNAAINYGGAISISARFYSEISPTLINCTLTSNIANRSGKTIYSSVEDNCKSTYSLMNCIAQDNSTIEYDNGSNRIAPTYNITYSNIQGGFSGTGNIDQDPLFVGAANGNYRLRAGSPSINTGDPNSTTVTVSEKDLDGNVRVVQNRIDMGVYEFQGGTEIYTIIDGFWNSPSVWSVNRLPLAGERVQLRHRITIPATYPAQAGQLSYDAGGNLIYSTNASLQLTP